VFEADEYARRTEKVVGAAIHGDESDGRTGHAVDTKV